MSDVSFFATATGGRRHIRQCPHLMGKEEVLACPPDDDRPVCDFCHKEISGHGRTYYEHLDAALDTFGAPVGNRELIKQALADVTSDEIWIPYSGSYIALGKGGRGVAWTGKTYVEPTLGQVIELPGYDGTERGGQGAVSDAWGPVCPKTFLQHSLSGRCDDCGASPA